MDCGAVAAPLCSVHEKLTPASFAAYDWILPPAQRLDERPGQQRIAVHIVAAASDAARAAQPEQLRCRTAAACYCIVHESLLLYQWCRHANELAQEPQSFPLPAQEELCGAA